MNILDKPLDIATAILLIIMIVITYMVYKWHTGKNSLDARSLFLDDTEKMSLGKTGQFIAMVISTWVIIYQTRAGLLTEWLFAGYMLAWAGAGVAGKMIDKKAINDAAVIEKDSK